MMHIMYKIQFEIKVHSIRFNIFQIPNFLISANIRHCVTVFKLVYHANEYSRVESPLGEEPL